MGAIPMECPKCGNRDVNKMLVTYIYGTREEPVHDTTTVAKLLYALEHPMDKRPLGFYGPLVEVKGYCCFNCAGPKIEEWEVGTRIPSRRYGI